MEAHQHFKVGHLDMVTVVATNAPFSLIGEIRGIFGQSSDILQLDAIGFYTNTSLPLSSYRKTNIVGEKMEMTSTTSKFLHPTIRKRNLSRSQIWSSATLVL